MSNSRRAFIKRTRQLLEVVGLPLLVGQSSPKPQAASTVLCNGVAIISFLSIEQFLRERMSEVLIAIGTSRRAFRLLPKATRKELTVSTVDALRYRRKILATQHNMDETLLYARQLRAFGTYDKVLFKVGNLHSGWSIANLGPEQVSGLLKSLQIKNGWNEINVMLQRVGSTMPDSKAVYQSAEQRRHKAAHDPEANVPINDLTGFVKDSVAIGMAFDLLLSGAAYRIMAGTIAGDNMYTTNNDMRLRFVDRSIKNKMWSERLENGSKAICTNNALGVVEKLAKKRAGLQKQSVVIRETNGSIRRWWTHIDK